MKFTLSPAALLCVASLPVLAADYTLHSFKKLQLTDKFWAEGANFADFNQDGRPDVVVGPYWYAGPDFQQRHEYSPATTTFNLKKPDGSVEKVPGFAGALSGSNAYSDNFLTYTYDFNADGWPDILVYGWPGKETSWYENPRGRAGHWFRHVILAESDNESPQLGDITGDGKPELICHSAGQLGYAELDWSDPTKPATFRAISPKDAKKYFRYTHGYGIGDVNGDGRVDLLEKEGWWEQPARWDGKSLWKHHPVAFSPAGGAQMQVYDVNGDGLADVITSLAAHGYGLAWHEQLKERGANGQLQFKAHVFMNKEPSENRYGVKFSQLHALALADMDGDGLKDIVTGKRFWAHGPSGDAEPGAPAVLYWFRLVRNGDKSVDWVPHLVDNDSGVGTQVTVGDLNGDGRPDIVVGNKKGAFVFLHEAKKVSRSEWEKAQPKPQ